MRPVPAGGAISGTYRCRVSLFLFIDEPSECFFYLRSWCENCCCAGVRGYRKRLTSYTVPYICLSIGRGGADRTRSDALQTSRKPPNQKPQMEAAVPSQAVYSDLPLFFMTGSLYRDFSRQNLYPRSSQSPACLRRRCGSCGVILCVTPSRLVCRN